MNCINTACNILQSSTLHFALHQSNQPSAPLIFAFTFTSRMRKTLWSWSQQEHVVAQGEKYRGWVENFDQYCHGLCYFDLLTIQCLRIAPIWHWDTKILSEMPHKLISPRRKCGSIRGEIEGVSWKHWSVLSWSMLYWSIDNPMSSNCTNMTVRYKNTIRDGRCTVT